MYFQFINSSDEPKALYNLARVSKIEILDTGECVKVTLRTNPCSTKRSFEIYYRGKDCKKNWKRDHERLHAGLTHFQGGRIALL